MPDQQRIVIITRATAMVRTVGTWIASMWQRVTGRA